MKRCCIMHQKANSKIRAHIGAMRHLMGGNPRYMLMVYSQLREKMSAAEIAAALNKECLCKREANRSA